MLYDDSPRWMAPLNLLAGFVGLLLALLTEFGAGVEFVGGAVVFMPLALLVVVLSSLCCVFNTLTILRKKTTMLGALLRMAFAVGIPGAVSLLALIAGKASLDSIGTISLTYTLLFIAALTFFWWRHVFPLVDYVAEIFVAVMICTNYDLAVNMGAGALWIHRIVCLAAVAAMVWGACRLIPNGAPIMSIAGLVAPLVSSIIWMVFECGDDVAAAAWMLIPIGIALAGTFLVCAKIYGFWDAMSSGGGGSSSGGGSYKAKDEDTIEDFVESRFENHSRAWDIGVVTKTGRFSNTLIVHGAYRVWKYHYKTRPYDYDEGRIKRNAMEIAKQAKKDFCKAHKDCPDFAVQADVKRVLVESESEALS